MLEYLATQIPYNYNINQQLLTAALLGGLVVFIMIFLQPFGTYSFESNYKYLIFAGFGLLLFMVYMVCARIENLWYNHKNKQWSVKTEIISFVIFILVSSILIHFYNQVFLNDYFNYDYQKY